jgi:predicted permease
VVGALSALLLVYSGTYRFIPSVVLTPVKMVGDTSFVLSMIILGCWMAKVDLQGVLKRLFAIVEISVLKLMVVPLIFLIVIVSFKLFSLLGLFIIFQASMPSAVSLPIIAGLYKANSEFISQGVFFSHLLSIFTIPIWIGIFLAVSGFRI